MARRSLKPQLNQIRAWVRQGRTDAWIAHQLEVSASELREFRKQHDLTPDGEEAGTSSEVDLRDEIEAEVEAATSEEPEEEPDEPEDEDDEADDEDEDEDKDAEKKPARKRPERKPDRKKAARPAGDDDGGSSGGGGGGERPRRRRRRGRRGGRGKRKEYEATFDHGERDGYGLWLDASVKDNPVYSEHWAGKREVTVRIDADQIVIRRPGEGGSGGPGDSDE